MVISTEKFCRPESPPARTFPQEIRSVAVSIAGSVAVLIAIDFFGNKLGKAKQHVRWRDRRSREEERQWLRCVEGGRCIGLKSRLGCTLHPNGSSRTIE